MKSYNSISHWNKGPFGQSTIAFDKIDGSNLRFEWGKKRGFYKFGTRNVMITEKDENFGDAIPLFLNTHADELDRIFRKKYSNIDSVVVFGEYYGENSFSGQHVKTDQKKIIIFDISLYKKGIISPKEFVDNFGHISIPNIVYRGEYNMEFVNRVRNNEFKLSEGVVCKGTQKTKGNEIVWMVKIKTNEWLIKVREKLGAKALADELNGDKYLIEQV